jgi:hypothetical protein
MNMPVALENNEIGDRYNDQESLPYFREGFSVFSKREKCSYFGPEWRDEQTNHNGIMLKRGLYYQNGKLLNIFKRLLEGKNLVEVARITNSSAVTVAKYRDVLTKLIGYDIKCHCGRSSLHMGACKYRRKSTLGN